jgi:hypothetical protein
VNLPGENFWSAFRGRVVVPFISIHFLCTVPAWSQRPASSLGPVVDLELPYTPADMVAFLKSGGKAATGFAVLDSGAGRVHFYRLDRSGEIITTQMLQLPHAGASSIVTADLNNDRDDDFVTLSVEPPALCISIRTAKGFAQREVPLEDPATSVVVADIDNDRRPDILLFGKSSTGVQRFMGKRDGRFEPAPRLFPDLSVSDLAVMDLNADAIADVLVADWLDNRLVTFYGIGRGIFSEQVATDLPDEPACLTLMPLTRDRIFGVGVGFAGSAAVAVYEGDATGNLRHVEELTFPGSVTRLLTAELSGDATPELLAMSTASVSVAPGTGIYAFASPVAFGLGVDLIACAAVDADGDRKIDLACIDRMSRRLVIAGNAASAGQVQWPAAYAVGMEPRGIAVSDVDGDGNADLIVANSKSSHLSLVRGLGDGRFSGQQAIAVAPEPLAVTAVNGRRGGVRALVSAHAGVDNVSIVRVESDSNRFSAVTVPTGSNPHVALARVDTASDRLDVLVRCEHGGDRSLTLSLFEQAGPRQYLERSVRPSKAGRVVALTVDDMRTDGRYDLVYVTRERKGGHQALNIAASQAGFDFTRIEPVMVLPDSLSPVRAIQTAHVNRDPVKDIILVYGAPRNAVAVLYGMATGRFADTLSWVGSMQPVDEQSLQVCDVNDDGAPDIVCLDAGRDAAVVATQRPEGGFRAPVPVRRAHGATGMRVASLKSPGQSDLILSWGKRGTVSIMFDAFRR